MKALISVDMEGVSGIVHSSETNPERYDYQRGRELMTAEANAVIAGVLDAEPTADVLVADAHGTFRNLLPEQLDRRARLVRGKPRALNMLAGLDEETDAALFVGYHVRAGEGPGVLAHTMNGEILDVRVTGRAQGEDVRITGHTPGEGAQVTAHAPGDGAQVTAHTPGEGAQVTARTPGDGAQVTARTPGEGVQLTAHAPGEDVRTTGRSLGEIGLNAAMAGHLGVPVVLLSGDDAACAEAAALIPEVVTVPVKEALGMAAVVTLHPEEARDRLRRAAADAVSRRTEIPPLALTGPLHVEVDLASPHTIDLATLVPGVSRTAGARTVAFTAPDYGTAYRLILLLAQLATIRPA
ncbi:M55 family metallopeptidase [Streptomyces rubiginosohelvolus]|uniref:M55 family metallopeptidase n=1 Tax=Streptomyces rubiginosohelvolus TaxID=67362 RepID=UPI0037171330